MFSSSVSEAESIKGSCQSTVAVASDGAARGSDGGSSEMLLSGSVERWRSARPRDPTAERGIGRRRTAAMVIAGDEKALRKHGTSTPSSASPRCVDRDQRVASPAG